MNQDTAEQLVFTGIPGKKVTAELEDVAMSSDGGVLLAAEVERHLGIVSAPGLRPWHLHLTAPNPASLTSAAPPVWPAACVASELRHVALPRS